MNELFRRLQSDYAQLASYWTFDRWLEQWPVQKRLAILESLSNDQLMCELVKGFVKFECGDFPSKSRLIQMYHNLHTQALFAPRFKALQKALGKHMDTNSTFLDVSRDVLGRDYDVAFTSGWQPDKYSKWMNENMELGYTWFYERDGKNWDATMNHRHIGQRLFCYGIVDPELQQFARKCRDVKGTCKVKLGRLIYTLTGTTKSGHNDTSLGNSITNAAIIVEAAHALGIQRMRVLVMGDDLLMATDEDFDCDKLGAIEAECGIKPEFGKFNDPTKVSFISSIWAQVGPDRYMFCPKPGKLLRKTFWTHKQVPPKKIDTWRRSIALGLWSTCQHLPGVRALLEPFAHGEADTRLMSRDEYYKFKRWHEAETPVVQPEYVRRWFCDRYGVSGDQVDQLEQLITDYAVTGGIISSSIADRMYEVDGLDPVDRT